MNSEYKRPAQYLYINATGVDEKKMTQKHWKHNNGSSFDMKQEKVNHDNLKFERKWQG